MKKIKEQSKCSAVKWLEMVLYREHESVTLFLSEIFFLFLILKQSKYGLKVEKCCF